VSLGVTTASLAPSGAHDDVDVRGETLQAYTMRGSVAPRQVGIAVTRASQCAFRHADVLLG